MEHSREGGGFSPEQENVTAPTPETLDKGLERVIPLSRGEEIRLSRKLVILEERLKLGYAVLEHRRQQYHQREVLLRRENMRSEKLRGQKMVEALMDEMRRLAEHIAKFEGLIANAERRGEEMRADLAEAREKSARIMALIDIQREEDAEVAREVDEALGNIVALLDNDNMEAVG
ncbi:MAG: hypothetical protein PHT12_04660 [Patescibacteria group bacterium]|nr:hypothetical protein [Patescibacteria group bacterium]